MPWSASNPVVVQPGDLRKPLRLFTRSDQTDIDASGGEGPPNYIPMFQYTTWAMDAHKRATFHDEAGKLITTVYHTYTVHYHPSIIAGIYIKDPDFANMLYVQGVVDPDGTRHWQELDAEDVEG